VKDQKITCVTNTEPSAMQASTNCRKRARMNHVSRNVETSAPITTTPSHDQPA